jgi:hypothetical protein
MNQCHAINKNLEKGLINGVNDTGNILSQVS